MNSKGILQIAIPFIWAIVVVVAFYGLGFIFGFGGDFIQHSINREVGLFFERIAENFLFIFDGNTAGLIVAVIIWLILTIWSELIVAES